MTETSVDTISVLVVEDDPINLLIARKLLEKHFTITSVMNGHDALNAVNEKHFDVVLMDINLGDEDLDGIEVLRRIKLHKKFENLKIYAVTSYAMPEDKERFLNEGFDFYFAKPINKDQIISKIQEDIKAN